MVRTGEHQTSRPKYDSHDRDDKHTMKAAPTPEKTAKLKNILDTIFDDKLL
jgi:hypothetical protein